MIIDIVRPQDLFHTGIGTALAEILVGGHRETWPIRSKRFRAFLRRSYYQTTGEAVSAAEIRSALDLLEARAQFEGAGTDSPHPHARACRTHLPQSRR
jgi:hypothetical protein